MAYALLYYFDLEKNFSACLNLLKCLHSGLKWKKNCALVDASKVNHFFCNFFLYSALLAHFLGGCVRKIVKDIDPFSF